MLCPDSGNRCGRFSALTPTLAGAQVPPPSSARDDVARGASAVFPVRAADLMLLSKADLATDMVLEFADMQGIAGSHYALNDGEPEAVAEALREAR